MNNQSRNALQTTRRRFLQAASVSLTCSPAISSESRASESNDKHGVAVVELFTSQGCSSCPPADAVLQTIARQAKSQASAVFPLSFHVDYWNRLGWTDPYSDARYSRRQRQYAAAMKSRRVYTPQMIVNGTTEFNGSNLTKANHAIKTALESPANVAIALNISDKKSNHLTFAYDIEGNTQERYLLTAITTSPKENKVSRGENAGRSLSHVNVVRHFEAIKLDSPIGTVELGSKIPLDAALGNDETAKLVAFVQDPATRQIVGATAVTLST